MRVIASWSMLIALGACSAPVDNPARPTVDAATGGDAAPGDDALAPDASDSGTGCPDVPQEVIAARCATSGCHSAADKAQGLDLQSPDLAARLVGVAATETTGFLLIDPAAPENSAVYAKLTAAPPYGARMPLGRTALDDATLACVLAWVGNPNNAGDDAGGD
jgi:hypothetical protein